MISKLLATVIALLMVTVVVSAAEPPAVPKRFKAAIGGYLFGGFEVELQNDILIYTTYKGGRTNVKTRKIKPTAAQWREFRQTLDSLKVWRWQAEYPIKAMDGTQWSLQIAYADRSLKSKGDNNYPNADGKPNGDPEPTASFQHYLDGVSKLIGGRSFR